MKEVPLTRGYVALVDDEDYERVMQFKWRALVTSNAVYAHRRIPGPKTVSKSQLMHRFIMGVSDHEIQVDHRNHNGLDNQRENLRICTGTQNVGNTRLSPKTTSGIKGVSWHRGTGKWRAHITIRNRMRHLGLFADINEAAAAYERAAAAYFGEFANPARRVAASDQSKAAAAVPPSPAA